MFQVCGECQTTLAKELLQYEIDVEQKCLAPLQEILDVRMCPDLVSHCRIISVHGVFFQFLDNQNILLVCGDIDLWVASSVHQTFKTMHIGVYQVHRDVNSRGKGGS